MDSIQLELPFPPEERWEDIPGYEGYYQVSNTGLVKRITGGKGAQIGRVLKPVNFIGYSEVGLSVNGKIRRYRIHNLVMLAFVGIPNGLEVNHINGIRNDNRLENLEYVTHRQNIIHARDIIKTLNPPRGEASKSSKLTNEQVREIRKLYIPYVMGMQRLAKIYGVAPQTISSIVKYKKWKHIE